MHTFEFAVLRLVPDPTRGEAVNLGIVVFKESGIDVRVGEVITRARLLYPELNHDLLSQQVATLRRLGNVNLPPKERHRTLANLGAFQLGELGYFSSQDKESYEARISALMSSFVATPRQPRRAKRDSPLVTSVRKQFRQEKVLAAIGDATAIGDHKIVPEWPIPNRPSLKANFALQNGAMRVCEFVDLDLSSDAPPPPSFFTGVVTLDAAKREANAGETVFAFRAKGPAARVDEALRIATPHASRFVDWEQTAQRETFMHDWIMAARSA